MLPYVTHIWTETWNLHLEHTECVRKDAGDPGQLFYMDLDVCFSKKTDKKHRYIECYCKWSSNIDTRLYKLVDDARHHTIQSKRFVATQEVLKRPTFCAPPLFQVRATVRMSTTSHKYVASACKTSLCELYTEVQPKNTWQKHSRVQTKH